MHHHSLCIFDGFNVGCEGIGWYWNQKKGVNILRKSISRYRRYRHVWSRTADIGGEEEEIKTELECQNESVRLSGSVCVFVPGMVTVTPGCMQNMIENFLFIICGLISVTKYIY